MSDKNNEQLIAKLISESKSGKVSRRRFMEGTVAAGVTVAGASSMWSSKVQAATPKRGGTMRVGMHDGNTSDSLDPGTTESVYMIQLNHASRSYLTEITETNGLGPDMADSWSASTDAKVWRFELAKGVTFHNGKTFTSVDAVASLNYHRGETKSAAKALLTDVESIKTDGDNAIIITMKSGNADLPFLLGDYHLPMLPAKGDGIDWESGTGAGPYKIVSHNAGVSTELVRHDGYHRDGLAHFDGVNLTVLNDPNSRQSALITGEVDVISDVDLKTVGLLGRAPGIEIDNVASGSHVTLPMFCDTEPFKSNHVRMALKLSIDRQAILDKILYGYGSIGNDHPIGASVPYHADLPQRSYDPDKAKWHLKEAGQENLSVSLSATDSVMSGAVDMCTLYKEQASKAGINIDVVREPSDGYWSNVWLKKPFVFVQWGARPTPDVMFSLAYKDDAAWNEGHWQNVRFNELLRAAKSELDQAKRTEMYKEMQMLCSDDGGTIVPFFRNRVSARRSNLKHGPNIAGNWEMDGARSYQRWWFDS